MGLARRRAENLVENLQSHRTVLSPSLTRKHVDLEDDSVSNPKPHRTGDHDGELARFLPPRPKVDVPSELARVGAIHGLPNVAVVRRTHKYLKIRADVRRLADLPAR